MGLMRKQLEAKDEINRMLANEISNLRLQLEDTKLMANELMRKAVNYTINQWKSLKNILKDGSAEISNNLCEQRMKPVKLLLKNCMNIGSEAAAENSAFIFSLIKSCKLNDIAPQDYNTYLNVFFWERIVTRRLFCHIFINRNVKTKYFPICFFIDCLTPDKVAMMKKKKFTVS